MKRAFQLEWSCSCGGLRGRVAGKVANRGVCYCHDCQLFATYLGRAEDILDAHGGSAILQVAPNCVSFASADKLAAVCLYPDNKRRVLRYFASCCKSPVGNAPSSYKLPMVGLLECSLSAPSGSIDEALGPVEFAVNRKGATGDRASMPDIPSLSKLGIARVIGQVIGNRIRGRYKGSPFFDAATGEPSCDVHNLTEAERGALL